MADKKLEAKAKPEAFGSVIAFSGYEFVKYEWRRVPEGFEESARAHAMLETRVIGKEEIKAVAEMVVEETKGAADVVVEESNENASAHRSRRKKTREAVETESEE